MLYLLPACLPDCLPTSLAARAGNHHEKFQHEEQKNKNTFPSSRSLLLCPRPWPCPTRRARSCPCLLCPSLWGLPPTPFHRSVIVPSEGVCEQVKMWPAIAIPLSAARPLTSPVFMAKQKKRKQKTKTFPPIPMMTPGTRPARQETKKQEIRKKKQAIYMLEQDFGKANVPRSRFWSEVAPPCPLRPPHRMRGDSGFFGVTRF